MGRIGPTEIIIVAVLIIVIFGWKKLPDAARSLGRSARVFKSEVDEMKKENEASKSEASTTTVRSEPIEPAAPVDAHRADERRQRRPREHPAHGQPVRARGLTHPRTSPDTRLHGPTAPAPSRPRGPDDAGRALPRVPPAAVHRGGLGRWSRRSWRGSTTTRSSTS